MGGPVLPGLPDPLQPTHPRVPANAHWSALVSPLLAEPSPRCCIHWRSAWKK